MCPKIRCGKWCPRIAVWNRITGLGMCRVCTEAIHSVARTLSQVWGCVQYVWRQSSLQQNLHETTRWVCFRGGERPGLRVLLCKYVIYVYIYLCFLHYMTNVCNMILYKRTPYKEEQTSNWSVSMTCLSLVRKGRKVSKSKHQLIVNRIFNDVFPTAPCIISFWNRKAGSMAARPSFLLGFINSAWGVAWWYSHVPLPECNCTRSQTQRSQWTGCRDVEAEEPIEVLVTVLYVKPQCEMSWLYCLHLFAIEIVSWCDWVPPAGLGIRGHRSRRSRHAVWCGRRHWWGRSQEGNQINSVASAHCPFTVSKLGGRDRNDKTWVSRDAVRIIFRIKPEHERMPHYQWLQPQATSHKCVQHSHSAKKREGPLHWRACSLGTPKDPCPGAAIFHRIVS